MDKIADLLEDAADYLDETGWYQGDFAPPAENGKRLTGLPVCAMGACRVATGEELVWEDGRWVWGGDTMWVHETLAHVLADTVGVARGTVSFWNDNPGRTKQEVVDAFRLAAKMERSHE